MKTKILTICRILVAVLFIFSGLVKANDPVGFAIKLEEYYGVFASSWHWTAFFFNNSFLLNTTRIQAAFLCSLEVSLGIALLLGIWPKLVAWLLLLLMLFFTWLTGYSAITGKVTDCGCFGDFIKLTPWQSFDKDIVLTLLIVVIFYLKKYIKPVFKFVPSVIIFIILASFSTWVSIHVLRHDVFFDWRPYAKGDNIAEEMKIPPDAQKPVVEMTYTYKNKSTGESKNINMMSPNPDKNAMDELSKYSGDSAWAFVSRKDKVKDKGFIPKISDFAVLDENSVDVKDYILGDPDYSFMIVVPDFDHTASSAWDDIDTFEAHAEKEGIYTFALASESKEEIDKFRHNHNAAFPFYSGDGKVCITIVRTNPGIVLLKEGTVIDKWSWRDLPSYEKVKSQYFPDRKPTVYKSPVNNELFAEGDDAADKIQNGQKPYNDFILFDYQENDITKQEITQTGTIYMIVANDITKITQDSWGSLLPELQALDTAHAMYFIVSSSPTNMLEEMKNSSGLGFYYFTCDKDELNKTMKENTGIVVLQNGIVTKKYEEGALPDTADLLKQ